VAANSPTPARHSATDVPVGPGAGSRAIPCKNSRKRVPPPIAGPAAIDESAIQITLK
jgi:hypothetical protein